MKKFKELEFKELVELFDFLKRTSNEESDEEQIAFADNQLSGFFPSLGAVQEMELLYICHSQDESAFDIFKKDYPDADVDETGRSEPVKKNYWEVKEKALNSIYEFAFHNLENAGFIDKSAFKANSQVYNAKNLACFKNMEYRKPEVYIFERKLFLDKFTGDSQINSKKFNSLEKMLETLNIHPQNFLVYVIAYIKNKKRNEISVFLEHLYDRITLLTFDRTLKSESNREFLEAINSILNKNN